MCCTDGGGSGDESQQGDEREVYGGGERDEGGAERREQERDAEQPLAAIALRQHAGRQPTDHVAVLERLADNRRLTARPRHLAARLRRVASLRSTRA